MKNSEIVYIVKSYDLAAENSLYHGLLELKPRQRIDYVAGEVPPLSCPDSGFWTVSANVWNAWKNASEYVGFKKLDARLYAPERAMKFLPKKPDSIAWEKMERIRQRMGDDYKKGIVYQLRIPQFPSSFFDDLRKELGSSATYSWEYDTWLTYSSKWLIQLDFSLAPVVQSAYELLLVHPKWFKKIGSENLQYVRIGELGEFMGKSA